MQLKIQDELSSDLNKIEVNNPDLVTEIHINTLIEDFSGINKFRNLKYLYIYDSRINSLDFPLECLSLEVILIRSCSVPPIESLSELPNLTRLEISNCNVKGIQEFPNLRNLVILDLFKNCIKNLDGNIFATKNKIQELNLNSNGMDSLSNLESLSDLRVLSVLKNNLSNLDFLKNLNQLKELLISHNPISNYLGLGYASSLKFIDVNSSYIQSKRSRIEFISTLQKHNSYLYEVDLSNRIWRFFDGNFRGSDYEIDKFWLVLRDKVAEKDLKGDFNYQDIWDFIFSSPEGGRLFRHPNL